MLAPRRAALLCLFAIRPQCFSALAVGNRTLYALNLRRHHPTEPRWQPPAQLLPRPSIAWQRCLLDTGSLTERLIASGGRFQVERLSQRWQRPLSSEAEALQLHPRRLVLIREVLLWVDQAPWIYGRTVMPATSLGGPLRYLRRLSNQSLGSQLFRYPGLRREPFELARIDPARHLPDAALRHCGDSAWLWGRRSRFSLQQRKLLVSEVFLPSFRL